jgi:membrane-bound metal-dependent hydrolase YbcI (DUF457 family)
MFLGHFGLGFGAKKMAPAISLGTFFVAAQFADLLWPTLVLCGVEQVDLQPGATVVTPLNFVSYPYSHSLLGLALWGSLFGVIYVLLRRARPPVAALLALLVLSHWLLDYITHRPDMPLTFHCTERFGLGLWNSTAGTLTAESALFAAGVMLYVGSTRPRDRIGSFGLWSLVAFFVAVYLASVFGPPPPNARAVAWSAQAMWLLVAWAYWVDSHRMRRRQV